ncbi:hypothetical protein AB0901_31040 [Streptomyces roseifaciens]
MIEQHPADADEVRPALVITPDGSAVPVSPAPEALVPVDTPAVYCTPQFWDAPRAEERLEELRQEARDAAALLAGIECLMEHCLPPQQGNP